MNKKLLIIKILAIISLCLIPLVVIPLGGIIIIFINIVSAIIILATDWKNKEINNNKTIWGILTLLLLGPISSLVFSIQSINIYRSINDNYDDIDNNQKQADNYVEERISHKSENQYFKYTDNQEEDINSYLIHSRLLQIKNLSIASLVSFILSTILLIIFSFTIPFIIWIPIIGISLSGIINIILGILILTTNWRNKDVIKDALIWGLLTLILIIPGPISSLIFISRAKNLKSLETIDNSSSEKQDQEIQ